VPAGRTEEQKAALLRAVVARSGFAHYLDQDPGRIDVTPGLWPGVKLLIGNQLEAEAKKTLPADKWETLLAKTDDRTIWSRYWLVEHLKKTPTAPLATIPELAQHIRSYRDFLRDARDDLIENGTTDKLFREFPWLDARLTRLLPIRLRLQEEPMSYDPDPVVEGEDLHELQRLRPKLLNIKLDMLLSCAQALGSPETRELPNQILRALATDLTGDELGFIAHTDRIVSRAMKRDRKENLPTLAGWFLPFEGQLSRLLLTASRIMAEVEIGTFSGLASSLTEMGVDIKEADSYFALVDSPKASDIDQAFDVFWDRAASEHDFWREAGEWWEKRLPVGIVAPAPPEATDDPPAIGKFSPPPGTTWESVDIKMIDNRSAMVTVGNEVKKLTYDQMGMADGRCPRPNKQWEALCQFARGYGIIQWNQFHKNV